MVKRIRTNSMCVQMGGKNNVRESYKFNLRSRAARAVAEWVETFRDPRSPKR